MAQVARQLQQDSNTLQDKEGKYLTFTLAAEDYGLEILKVREIIGMMDITAVPQTPEYVKGVINLRGRVIPVIDLRLKFGLEAAEYGERTCIIVVEVQGAAGAVQMGVVVDSVSEVLNISGDDIEPPPSFGSRLKTQYILGIAKAKGTIKILLDIDKVLTGEEMAGLESLGS
ncbi:MAG: purine-binding chemotaxis protein CheW [Deltaproteobacteria bacterium]|nr:purine-binding chemotaxis protein CheW [Deltaproteobacteria bacterium]MBI4796912.1 purine-binding chemotaxis protein CheW [Deltaproteobacteria bacterium]